MAAYSAQTFIFGVLMAWFQNGIGSPGREVLWDVQIAPLEPNSLSPYSETMERLGEADCHI